MQWYQRRLAVEGKKLTYKWTEQSRTFEIQRQDSPSVVIHYDEAFPFSLEGTYCEFDKAERFSQYDFRRLMVIDLLQARGESYKFDLARYQSTVGKEFQSTYFGLCFLDIYNMALAFREANAVPQTSGAIERILKLGYLMKWAPGVFIMVYHLLIAVIQVRSATGPDKYYQTQVQLCTHFSSSNSEAPSELTLQVKHIEQMLIV